MQSKGRVGKTTTTLNLAGALADYGRKVLLVDFDPQGALSAGMNIRVKPGDLTIYSLMQDEKIEPQSVIRRTKHENIDIIPADIELSAVEITLVNEVARERILKSILRKVEDNYDVIFIDCQPSLGLLTVNALTAAHGVIIPTACDYLSLRGVSILLNETVDKVRSRLNEVLQLDGVVATMYDARTLHGREALEKLKHDFGDKLFNTVIGLTVKFKDSTAAGEPITTYAPDSEAAEAYREVARELVVRGCAP